MAAWITCWRIAQRTREKTTRMVGLNLEVGDGKEGRLDLSKVGGCSTGYLRQSSLNIRTSQKVPFLNPDPLMHWSGPENIAWVKINDDSSWNLLDSGSTINAVTPEFMSKLVPWTCWSLEQSGWWYPEDKWLWKIIFLTLGLCHHIGIK